jgi:hypothetical protein
MELKDYCLIPLILSCLACAPKTVEPIMTDEKFDSRVLNDGLIEFVYGISWRNTSQASLGIEENRMPRGSRQQGEREDYPETAGLPLRLKPQADNKTKLELEDKAAAALQKRLQREDLCSGGYQITEVIWREDNIRLLGHCL